MCIRDRIVSNGLRADPTFVFSDLLKALPPMVASPEIRRPCREEDKDHLVRGFVDAFRRKFPQMAHTIVKVVTIDGARVCLLYTSDAADDLLCVDLGGRRIIKK